MGAIKTNTVPTNGVELIVVQFRLTPNEWVKLPSLKNILPAGKGKRENGPHKKGRKFLPATENVIVFSCNEDLFAYYKLVDAFHDETPEEHLAQFIFVKGKNGKISDEFKKIGLRCLFAFNTLRKKHLWRTQGYINPGEFADKNMVAINCHRPVHTNDRLLPLREKNRSLFVFGGEIGLF